jgi:hypothetical protein
MDRIELPFEPRHLGVPSGASKMISKPVVQLGQTMHLSCTDTNTVYKWTKIRFHMTYVTFLYRVCPKQFLSLWYVQLKLCTYLASRLALSPNGPKLASTWASSPMSTIRSIQNSFWAYGNLSYTETNTISNRTKTRLQMTNVTWKVHRVRPKWFLSLWYIRHIPCTYLAPRLALSPNWPNRASTWVSSPRSTITCV